MMNTTTISLKYARAIALVPDLDSNDVLAASLNAEMMNSGFIASQKLFEVLRTLPTDELIRLHETVIPALRKMVGADVIYRPMYPNFPRQVMEASHLELYLNAILHYWSFGQWKPDYEKLPREFSFERTTFKEIGVISEIEFSTIFTKLLASNESLSDDDKAVINWFMEYTTPVYPDVIPFKENLCYVAGKMLSQCVHLNKFDDMMSTATDVLRVATYLSDGDISLAANTKFKSLPRRTRRILVSALNRVGREEDFQRHRGKWVRLFHSLHVNEYADKRLAATVKKVRENKKIETFAGQVEAAIERKDIMAAVDLLKQRPGDFTRRVDHLLRLPSRKKSYVIDNFLNVAPKVPTRTLCQLLGNLKVRDTETEKRVVFPKGNVQRATVLHDPVPALSVNSINKLSKGIKQVLTSRFSAEDPLGNVWIDPALSGCPLPTQQRSASNGLFSVARGTRLPIDPEGTDLDTLRFFIYWIGNDIDLSATLHDEKFEQIAEIAYYDLKGFGGCHSGDIVSAPAPNGASEFIDISMNKAIARGGRYIAMHVMVYSGPTFAEHEKCYAGWMTRQNPDSNEVYEPKTVKQKIDLTSETRNSMPVVFDLVEKKVIWTDLSMPGRSTYWGNNVASNRAGIAETLEAIVDKNNKVNLYELFELHAKARGRLVKDKEKANVVFSLNEGTTPFDVPDINAEYLV